MSSSLALSCQEYEVYATSVETVRLNLGCGSDIRPGWVNVDKFPQTPDVVAADLPQVQVQYGFSHGVQVLQATAIK